MKAAFREEGQLPVDIVLSNPAKCSEDSRGSENQVDERIKIAVGTLAGASSLIAQEVRHHKLCYLSYTRQETIEGLKEQVNGRNGSDGWSSVKRALRGF